MFEQKVENDTVEAGGVGGEVGAMAALGLDVGLEVRGAAEIGAEGIVENAGAVALADDVIVLARDDQGGALEVGCIEAGPDQGQGVQLARGKRMLGGLGVRGHGVVVGARLEEVVDVAVDVARGDVGAVEVGPAARPLQACHPRREPLQRELPGSVEPVAGENGGIRQGRVLPYDHVRGVGAEGVTHDNQISRLADRGVGAIAHGFGQRFKNGNCDGDLSIIAGDSERIGC